VDKDARGKGYAKALVNDALQTLFAQGCVKVSLDTRTGNTRARSLYSSLGFQLLEVDDDYVHFVYYKNQPVAKSAIEA
jgi:ribosomal protein S18 acetylase RimI-like enzyme